MSVLANVLFPYRAGRLQNGHLLVWTFSYLVIRNNILHRYPFRVLRGFTPLRRTGSVRRFSLATVEMTLARAGSARTFSTRQPPVSAGTEVDLRYARVRLHVLLRTIALCMAATSPSRRSLRQR